MTQCDIIPLARSKACSGKCKSGACKSSAPHIWVIAACEGIISLFEKNDQGALIPMLHEGQTIFPSLAVFQEVMTQAEDALTFDQLILIGSSGDLAWIHAALSEASTRRIVAEIEYPLVSAWFRQSQPLPQLTQALENLFAA